MSNSSCPPELRKKLRGLVGRFVVLRTPSGTIIGCLRQVGLNYAFVRVYRGPGDRFSTVRIPLNTIIRAHRFPCSVLQLRPGSGTKPTKPTKPELPRRPQPPCGC